MSTSNFRFTRTITGMAGKTESLYSLGAGANISKLSLDDSDSDTSSSDDIIHAAVPDINTYGSGAFTAHGTTRLWTCCGCGHSGMAVGSSPACPFCGHNQCGYCQQYKPSRRH